MIRKILGIMVSLLLLTSISAAETSEETKIKEGASPLEEYILFHLDFENGATPRKAITGTIPRRIRIGSNKGWVYIPNQDLQEQYITKGLKGKGLTNASLKEWVEIAYPLKNKKNINYKDGTIIWWLKFTQLSQTKGGGLVFNIAGGSLSCVITPDPKARNKLIVTLCAQDQREKLMQAYIKTGLQSVERKEGIWTQMGFSWDKESLHFIVNGERVATKPLKRLFKEEQFADFFIVALFDWNKTETDIAVMDEFTIYNRSLSSDETKMEYIRLKPLK